MGNDFLVDDVDNFDTMDDIIVLVDSNGFDTMGDEFDLVDVTGFDTMDDISGLVDVDILDKIEVDSCWFDVSGVDTMAVGKTNRTIRKYPRRKPQLRSTSPFIVSKQFASTQPTPSFLNTNSFEICRARGI
jgi:hypothetical protein